MNRLNKTVLGTCLVPFVFFAWASAEADSTCGLDAPQVMLDPLEPAVTESTIQLTGDVLGSCLSEIVWSSEWQPETPIPASTGWDGVFSFAKTIVLNEGENHITVQASSAAGSDSAAATVVYNLPLPPPPPPPGAEEIVDNKGKITLYTDPGQDRFNNVGYLESSEAFEMPCDKDVTVTGYVANPDDPDQDLVVFSDLIPAGDWGACNDNRFRKVRSETTGLREINLQRISSTRVYAYVFARNGNYPFPVEKTAPEYLTYVGGSQSYRLDIQIGDQTFSGRSNGPDDNWSKEKPCDDLNETIYSKKVELRCNR